MLCVHSYCCWLIQMCIVFLKCVVGNFTHCFMASKLRWLEHDFFPANLPRGDFWSTGLDISGCLSYSRSRRLLYCVWISLVWVFVTTRPCRSVCPLSCISHQPDQERMPPQISAQTSAPTLCPIQGFHKCPQPHSLPLLVLPVVNKTSNIH